MSSEPGPSDPRGASPPQLQADVVGLPFRRLHPAGIAVLAVRGLRDIAIPLAIAFFTAVAGGGGGEPVTRIVVYGIIGALAAVVIGIVGWATTRWSVGDGRIRLRTGVLSEKITDVPLARVQSIDTVHGPLQRLFGVVGAHVQTAGGGRDAEIKLAAITPADVALLRAAVGRRGGTVEAPEPDAERRLSRVRLVLAALTAGQLGVLLPVLAGASQVGEQLWGGDVRNAGREGLDLIPDSAPVWIAAVAGLLLAAWLLSIAGAVIAFSGFTIARDGDRLLIRRGLLARRESTVPVARVQAVHVVEGVLRQPFGLAALRVEVAGYAKEAAAAQTLFPLLRVAEVAPFLRAMLPELADRADGLAPAPPRALRRYVLPPAALALLAGAVAAVVLGSPWPLLAAAPGALYGAARFRAAGWRLQDGRLALRFRRLARTTVLAPAGRLQEHGTRQTVLQRRARLADIEVKVGAGTVAAVRHLDVAVAGRLFDALRRG